MPINTMRFMLHEADGSVSEKLFSYSGLYAIGYAGRNTEKTMAHIRELEEQLGVPAPKKIPTIFQMSHQLLTQEQELFFVGEKTCGEVEYIMLTDGDEMYIGLGSDHTDRELESVNVEKAKQIAPKPIAPDIWRYEDMKSHWDGILLRSYQKVNGVEQPYQEGTLADILPADYLLKEMRERVGDVSHAVIFSGTVPLLKGFVFGESFRMEMEDTVLKRTISHGYSVSVITEEER